MANIWQESTPTHEIQEFVRSFRHFLQSCFGPNGGIKMLVSAAGYLTVTSTSSQLVKNLSFNHPIINLIINFMKSQQSVYEDHGLYVGIVSSFLTEQSWTHGRVSSHKALKFVCDRCLTLLESGSADVGLSSASRLLTVTKSVLSSKPGCMLSNSDARHLSLQLVKGFLSSVGDEAETVGIGKVVTTVHSGPNVQASELLEGILYPYPEDEPLTLKLCDKPGPWNILLYTCMLNLPPVSVQEADHVSFASHLQHYSPIVSYFRKLAPKLLQAEVRLIACQKVVHPEIQVTLRRAGIVVLHRLGTQQAQGLQRISGATVMDLPTSSEWQQCIGILDSVTPIRRHEKLYLQLKKNASDVNTLLLCSTMPKSADELEVVARQSQASLAQLLAQPKIIPGAGCFESWLAWKLREDIQLCTNNSYNTADLQGALSWVEHALYNIPRLLAGTQATWELMQDSLAHHAWKENAPVCLCGSLNRSSMLDANWTELPLPVTPTLSAPMKWTPTENSIVDIYRSKSNALRLAFDACQAVIAIGSIIHT